jgi:serine/threonine-protein kinase HipA
MKLAPISQLKVSLAFTDTKVSVGRLAAIGKKIYFEFDEPFLRSDLDISPFELPRQPGAQAAQLHPFDGLFGVFNDSLPDGWGRLLLDRRVQSLNIAPQLLTPLDRLAHVGKFGMGALVYEPSIDEPAHSTEYLDLDQLAQESQAVLEGTADTVLEKLLTLSGSSSGARPKVMIGYSPSQDQIVHGQQDLNGDYEHWLIKFRAQIDPSDAGPIEFAFAQMAAAAGVDIMPTQLFPSPDGIAHFGTQRFDRVGNKRLHLHSLCGLLHSDHRFPALDYAQVLTAIQRLTRDIQDVEKAFRLCCFNVFAHNRDDHSKNFSFLMSSSGQWKLAPAYDLTFSSGPNGEHCTSIMREGKQPGKTELMALASKFGFKPSHINAVIDEVQTSISQWKKFATQAGVTKKMSASIGKVLKGLA